MKPASWHIVTPEFPPQIGGVADYSSNVAEALRARGEKVCVWHPHSPPLAGRFSPSALAMLHKALEETPAPRRLFVQWVPHGYGYKAMNLPFCWWLHQRARRGDTVDLMAHEAFLPFREGSWRQDAVAAAHRVMIALALRAARRVWVSIPRWTPQLRPWLFGKPTPIVWLPVPSNIPRSGASGGLEEYFMDGAPVVGHFGTYSSQTLEMLKKFVPGFLHRTRANLLLLGRDSDSVARGFSNSRVVGAGALPSEKVSRLLAACTVLYQPYTDGVSTRRSSAMAALSHGKALVTSAGAATEGIWSESGAAVLTAVRDWRSAEFAAAMVDSVRSLLSDQETRRSLEYRAEELYEREFALPRLVERLCAVPEEAS